MCIISHIFTCSLSPRNSCIQYLKTVEKSSLYSACVLYFSVQFSSQFICFSTSFYTLLQLQNDDKKILLWCQTTVLYIYILYRQYIVSYCDYFSRHKPHMKQSCNKMHQFQQQKKTLSNLHAHLCTLRGHLYWPIYGQFQNKEMHCNGNTPKTKQHTARLVFRLFLPLELVDKFSFDVYFFFAHITIQFNYYKTLEYN